MYFFSADIKEIWLLLNVKTLLNIYNKHVHRSAYNFVNEILLDIQIHIPELFLYNIVNLKDNNLLVS